MERSSSTMRMRSRDPNLTDHPANVTEMTLPGAGDSTKRASPRCSRATRATTARPNPVPRARFGVNGTNAFSRSSAGMGWPGSRTVSCHPCGTSATVTSTRPPPASSAATAAWRQRIFTAVRTRTESSGNGGSRSGTSTAKETPRDDHSASTPSTASRTGPRGSPGTSESDGGRANSSTSLRSSSMLSTSRSAMFVRRRSLEPRVPWRSRVCSAIFTAESGLRTSCATSEAKRARSSARSAASASCCEAARSRAARSPPGNRRPAGLPTRSSVPSTGNTGPATHAMRGSGESSQATAHRSCAPARIRSISSHELANRRAGLPAMWVHIARLHARCHNLSANMFRSWSPALRQVPDGSTGGCPVGWQPEERAFPAPEEGGDAPFAEAARVREGTGHVRVLDHRRAGGDRRHRRGDRLRPRRPRAIQWNDRFPGAQPGDQHRGESQRAAEQEPEDVRDLQRLAGRLSAHAMLEKGPMSRDRDRTVRSHEHNSRGIHLADRGWLDEAIKEFKKAIALDLEPDSATAHYNLACFLATHASDMAVDEYKEAIELDPDYPDAHLNLGMTYADQDRREEAKEEFKAAIELDSDDPVARHELAALLMDEADYRGAIAQLNEAVRLEPENYEAHLDLGICYAQKGFYAEAERCYGRARELNPDDVLLNYNVAALYSLWEKPAQAFEALKKALEKDPVKVRGWIAADPMFDTLKGDPQFEQILAVQ